MTQESLVIVYYVYFHSVTNYGIFWGSSPYTKKGNSNYHKCLE